MADAAKQQRTTSKRNFTRKWKTLDAALKTDGTSLAEINACYDDVCTAWKVVEAKHDAYLDVLDDTNTNVDQENQWIQDVEGSFVDARKRVLAFRAASESQYSCSVAKRAYEVSENNFRDMCSSLELLLSSPEALPETLTNKRFSLSTQFDKLKDVHSAYTTVASPDVVDQLNTKMTNYTKKYNMLKISVDKKITSYKQGTLAKKTPFRMEKMPLPRFDGQIRQYPQFKKDFRELVLPSVSTPESSYTLRQCLSREVNDYLGSCNEDVELMFKRLDLKYGDPSKIVDSILTDLHRFKKLEEGEHEKLIKFIDAVEMAHRDLKELSLASELTNTNTVSIIENKLPKQMQMEWYRFMHQEDSKVDKFNKFPSLLQFLSTERDVLQYSMSGIRSNPTRASGIINVVSSEVAIPSSSCIIHFWSENHATADCRTYNNLSHDHKLNVLRERSACTGCLGTGHSVEECTTTSQCTVDSTCVEKHHPSLHTTPSVDGTVSTIVSDHVSPADILLPFMKVETGSPRCNYLSCLWDTCANVCLITHSKARLLRLKGKPAKLFFTGAGGVQSVVDSLCYSLCLLDRHQVSHSIKVFGIDKITREIPHVSPETISGHFGKADLTNLARPSGDVDLLIGYQYAGCFPEVERRSGHLVVLSNIFGKCVGGRCPGAGKGSTTVNSVVVDSAVVNLLEAKCVSPCHEFLTIESLGVQCNPKCGNCRCGTCPLGGKEYSIREERELMLIEDKLEFKGDHWEAGLPYVKDPCHLPSDYEYALKRFKAHERRLAKEPSWETVYHQKMQEFISSFARKLTPEEMVQHKGPFHYVCHHAVAQPASESTPVRIVWDSSHQSEGQSLNDFLAKGPDAYMNTLMSVLLQFREDRVGIAGDIRKMYNSISLRENDQHMHRFLYRTDSTKPPDTYVITVVNIGDKPSGAIATVALRKTASMGKDQFPNECRIVTDSSYVDDITSSVSSGDRAEEVTSNISRLLKPGNFHIKKWQVSGQGEGKVVKILGSLWNPLRDTLSFRVRLNFSKKIRNVRSGPDITPQDIQKGFLPTLTRCMAMSSLNSIFDYYGLLVPFTTQGKVKMRDLWSLPDWTTPLDTFQQDWWVKFFCEMMEINELEFPRAVKPDGADEQKSPTLVIFSDASEQAYGCCAYVRWEMVEGDPVSRLLVAKSRVAPLKKTTIVRLELSAAVLSKRLRVVIENAFHLKFGRVIHIIDSRIVKGMISKESYGFKTFVAIRVGEIQTGTVADEWYWVESKFNIADIITRGAAVCDLGKDSHWQNGLPFMKLPISEWPLHQTFPTSELPEQISQVLVAVCGPVVEPIDIRRFSDFNLLLHVTAHILSLRCPNPSLFNLRLPVTPDLLENAKLYWIQSIQKSLIDELEKGINGKGNYRKLNVQNCNGVYVATGRIGAWNQFTYNKKDLPILPASHDFSKLYALHVHNRSHRGPRADIARIRTEFWMTGIQRLVKNIRYSCVTCRRLYGKLLSQVMAPLPSERLKPAPMWYYTALDLFGYFEIRGEVNKRSVGKSYGVIFTCLLTHAVYVDISSDYSTDAFLLTFRRFVSLRGYPSKIFSDVGSQLVAASKELKEMFNDFDWERIKAESARHGLEWKFSPPDAPWYNGCCEALIRSVKKSITHAVGLQKLSYSELQTTFFECANIVNERPIGVTPSTVEDGSYICPNDMLLGRSSNKPPSGNFDTTINSRRRLYFVQRLVDAFWKKWMSDYFPTLLERKTWHHSKRNVASGDIVIIQDKDLKRSRWRLGLVRETYLGTDGKVRRVLLRYINSSGAATEVERPVQRLVLLVPTEERND